MLSKDFMTAYLLGHLCLDVILRRCYPELLKNKGVLADKLKLIVFYTVFYERIATIKASLSSVDLKFMLESAAPPGTFCNSKHFEEKKIIIII